MAGAKRSPMSAAGFAWRLLLVHLGSSFLAGLTFYELKHLLWGSLWQCTLLGVTWLSSCCLLQHWVLCRNGAYAEERFARKAALWF